MSKLFSALRIGQLEVAHRLVTTIDSEARLDAAGYRRRTTAGGLIITEACAGCDADRDGWSRISDAIHEAGGLVVALLAPTSERARADGIEIDPAMVDFQRVARFARSVGFDGVELDAREGSLPGRFLHPQTNGRDDDYGGDVERRMRFLLEAAHVLAGECSTERVGVRLSPCSREGQTDLFAAVMQALSERELAYIHLSPSGREHSARTVSIASCADRQVFRSDISSVLIASGEVDVTVAGSAVESRWADAIGFLQANDDPEFVGRLLRQEEERRRGEAPARI
jgi:N-ethylmaleimide reductase